MFNVAVLTGFNLNVSHYVILGQIKSSSTLSPVVHCYAALSHTWLSSPPVLSLTVPTPLFSLLFAYTSTMQPLLFRL